MTKTRNYKKKQQQCQGSRFEDGSKSDSEAGLAVCILEHGEPHEVLNLNWVLIIPFSRQRWRPLISPFAGLWKKIKINIITDSQSSIEALRRSRSRSEVVIKKI
ncbi:hypothetical protein AVEN_49650-1 [Araneus ventricosus]|uniref:RNase H type-1 domain-containing protein n=1 Tax=Araneus ventricosus TaxID=182803 RepID=A0A4Y2H6X3_ARAVE|nr:hypothetical protein AVEN_49650-1 [Araneus ventricosus]